MHPTIHYLENKNLLWRGNTSPQVCHSRQQTGFKELDDALQGGFPEHGVIELRSPIGIGELRLILPSILARHQQKPADISAFIAPPIAINSEMLAELGFALEQIIVVQPKAPALALWSAEQSLKSGGCHSVVLWCNNLTICQVKRLQLAAEKGGALLFIIRARSQHYIPLPVTLALTLSHADAGIQVQISKRKGAWPSQALTINMVHYWPELSVQNQYHHRPNTVVYFPARNGLTG
ncbi:translesion DNA synthesis-associated protein ImuA [Paraglaciecola aquimarina]|uniref:Translesion DNA synthesis-associated protein ImuA n=1 Tax=Paraglaciecola aquimarina TaxID=1235557 RepID=A0ABU3SWI5_9ALTE|nr:translesion DNA synthesis-associated protein ImuA [Paraglaciecola aquimarina]MDU0354364.1 translesion DNA synthesis-associated protein ImuA [Paraglaciecola aquimarina]